METATAFIESGYTLQDPSTNEHSDTSDRKIEICLQGAQNDYRERIVLYVEPTITVAELKLGLQEWVGTGPSQQHLIYAGKQLKDETTLINHNIQGGVIYIVHLGHEGTLAVLLRGTAKRGICPII